MIDPKGFLMIEPQSPPAAEPIIDALTRQVTALYRASVTDAHGGYRGFHVCKCGACSDNHDHFLPGHVLTNSLCIHYIAYHRHDLTRAQLGEVVCHVAECGVGTEAEPTEDELQRPRKKHY
jgi:hypothetical protein